jgi:hypothetical protein
MYQRFPPLTTDCIQAKNNKGVSEVFETLLRDIISGDASAGTGAGSGGVLGAGATPSS